MSLKPNLRCHSALYDEKSFFSAFLKDIGQCKKELIIESPYITRERMKMFKKPFQKLLGKGVNIYVFTRSPEEHNEFMQDQSELEIEWFEEQGIYTLLCRGNHHRKLAIVDRQILWEGSLNILSHSHSREIMRRLEGGGVAKDTYSFLNFEKFIE